MAATDDTEVNREVSEAAEARRLFCNVVDDPALSSFQVPSIVDRSPVIVAISSSGVAPVLARRLRERIESLFDHTLGQLAGLAERYRQRIRAGHPDLGARRRFYDWLLDGPVAGLLRQQPDQAEAALAARPGPAPAPRRGQRGAGGRRTGDPGLLTLKALRALNEADVIMYDRLVSDDIMALARRDATRVSVGKQPGETITPPRPASTRCWSSTRAPDAAWCGSRAATPSSSDAAARNSNTCASTACAMRWCPASRPRWPAPPTPAFR